MLKAMLEQETKHRFSNRPKRHLFSNIPNAHAGIVNFFIDLSVSPELLVLNTPGNTHQAYYLPWNMDTGLYIDLPAQPAGNDPVLFITANLTGCCVGIQNFGGFIRVRHYNLYTEGNHNPAFSQDDLFRYGTNIFWLLPADKYKTRMINRAKPYTHEYIAAVIWGEYKASDKTSNSKWHFYYQDGTTDNVIHELSYQ